MADANNDNELYQGDDLEVTDGGAAKFAPVEVKSGEEDLELGYETKGKIYRFDEGENQWKERGQGTARILIEQAAEKKFMFIFRRDGVGKLSAQHYLIHGMTLKPMAGSDKAFVWTTGADYSDDPEGFPDTFALRFANKDLADGFKSEFEKICK